MEVDPSIIERLKGLSIRLRLVESRNDEVAQNLISMRSSSSFHQYKSAIKNNTTEIQDAEFLNNAQLTLPSIYNYMSHLLGSKNSLVPATQVSAGRHGGIISIYV